MATSGLIDPLGSSSAPFRELRIAADVALRPGWLATLLMTAPIRGEGTTTLAVNQALVTAATPRRTLLVDANLHHPQVHERLGCARSPGLTEVLRGECSLAEAVQIVAREDAPLDLLAAGEPVRRTADLLSSDRMAELLAAAQARYDAVVADSPPVLELPDAAGIAGLNDVATVIVADARQRRQRLSRTIARLERGHARVLGIVLNRAAAGAA
jgi:Mrp family chromosome partitioning ATPase